MSFQRRHVNALLAGIPLAGLAPLAHAQSRRDSVVLGMVLEPPGLDPTSGAAAAIGEIVHYNVLEGLTKIGMDGSVTPLLAESWLLGPDGKTYSFVLRKGVKFSDGKPFDASAVKFSFERAKAPGSTNKAKKALFDNISRVEVVDAHRVILVLDKPDAATPFRLGENTAVILHPDSAAQAATKPVGTGPFTVENWAKGSAVTLARWDGHRDASKVRLKKVTFRFINDPAAQVAALLAGDIDGMPRFGALQALKQFQADKRFTVEIGSTAGKGIMAINNRKPPFNDVRVRRALSHAIDRQAFINGAQEGLGRPIGSHFAPTDLGYLDLTKTYPHDPDKARALLREAGVTTPLNVTLTLPPPQYARKGGEIIAAQLAKVGINARIENVEWAQWLAGPFKGNFDLTIINHVEPLDYATAYADPNYYFGYDSARFRGMVATLAATSDQKEKARLWREIQRQLAEDAVNVFIWNPAQVAVFRRGLRGLWNSSPIFANDMAAVSWAPAGA
ncbi:MAG: ABC transporter substrate-binding protein [Pseudomonadota bacterium]|jgi:peptide/nickel transport system substrate-binding protein|nr:ABC transporter substrate-binding protein [Rubrivivax sp.]MCA3259266.1 ABC transporter substrate-binding protein [Rubrivivax sp.]MCE2912897.1 ABC transporter substrate-binding protein [Rubrivivax sp.]MCZ8031265.1 ABC transporter substrate-binding protein [Rubrivivax sp.]